MPPKRDVAMTKHRAMDASEEGRDNDEAPGTTFRNLDCNCDEDFVRSEDGIVYLW